MKSILAMAKNRCIGKDGKLPWHFKDELRWFKELTVGHALLVGRKTFEGLPPLKNRDVWVLTRETWSKMMIRRITNQYGCDGYEYTLDMLTDCNKDELNDLWVCGGKSVYEFMLPSIDEFYVTHLNDEFEGDTFMAPFEHLYKNAERIKEFDFGYVIKYSK